MKLRIQDASIRLRLAQSEIDEFADRGRVDAETPLGTDTVFRYAIMLSKDADSVAVTFNGGTLSVLVPEEIARAWTTTQEVGFEAEQAVDGQTLSVLVEKDFQCLHKKPDDRDPDAFAHPMEHADG